MRFVVVFSLLILMTTTSTRPLPLPHTKSESLISEIYKNLNAFKASSKDRKSVTEAGGAPTYGEILPSSVSHLISYLDIKQKDVFYDLGSGNGKVPFQFYLTTPIKKSVGVELSDYRHNQAMKAKLRAGKKGVLTPRRSLQYIHGDILKIDFSDATIVYLCSTCYTPEMMTVLQEKISHLRKGAKIITLKEFSENNKLRLIKELELPMTWSKSTSVYIYEVV